MFLTSIKKVIGVKIRATTTTTATAATAAKIHLISLPIGSKDLI